MSERTIKRFLAEAAAAIPSIRTHEDGKAVLHDYLRRVARDKAETTFLHVTTTPGFTAELADEVAKTNCLQIVVHTWGSMEAYNLAAPDRATEAEEAIVEAYRQRFEELFLAASDDGGRQ